MEIQQQEADQMESVLLQLLDKDLRLKEIMLELINKSKN